MARRPAFHPCDCLVLTDEVVYPCDDVEAILRSQGTFTSAPRSCRYSGMLWNACADCLSSEGFQTGKYKGLISPECIKRVETCLIIGDESNYWMHIGVTRPIAQEDALRHMQRSRDDSFFLRSALVRTAAPPARTSATVASTLAAGTASEPTVFLSAIPVQFPG